MTSVCPRQPSYFYTLYIESQHCISPELHHDDQTQVRSSSHFLKFSATKQKSERWWKTHRQVKVHSYSVQTQRLALQWMQIFQVIQSRMTWKERKATRRDSCTSVCRTFPVLSAVFTSWSLPSASHLPWRQRFPLKHTHKLII